MPNRKLGKVLKETETLWNPQIYGITMTPFNIPLICPCITQSAERYVFDGLP